MEYPLRSSCTNHNGAPPPGKVKALGTKSKPLRHESRRLLCFLGGELTLNSPSPTLRAIIPACTAECPLPGRHSKSMKPFTSSLILLILEIIMGAGYGGASGRSNAHNEQAFSYAFVLGQHRITR